MNRKPGRVVGVVGSLAAVTGVLVVVVTFLGRPYGSGGLGTDGLVLGGFLLFGGLLLRIEAAVAGSAGEMTSDGR